MTASQKIRDRKIAGQQVQGIGFQTFAEDLIALAELVATASKTRTHRVHAACRSRVMGWRKRTGND